MYEDMYKDYSSNNFTYEYPITFEGRNRAYLYLQDPINIGWYYGDTIELLLILTDINTIDLEDIPEYFEDKNLYVTFYNFRGEEVTQFVFTKDDLQAEDEEYYFSCDINREISSKKFKRGIYRCGVVAIGTDENGTIDTLLNYNDFTVQIM